MSMDLATFGRYLVELIGQPTTQRPFVCAGSPLECNVFIVGFNPASPMEGDWWADWSTLHGFDKETWMVRYLDERKNRPLKPEKNIAAP